MIRAGAKGGASKANSSGSSSLSEKKQDSTSSSRKMVEDDSDIKSSTKATPPTEKVRLFGVGGKNVKGDDAGSRRRVTPGELRLQKDMAELDGGTTATLVITNRDDLTAFSVDIAPTEGFWRGATYRFNFNILPSYPFDAPRVTCGTKIYHPNVDLQGNVCLNILRPDWKPVFDVNTVIYGLIHLFVEPNPTDPLNIEAAELLRGNRVEFERVVRKSLRGEAVGSESFPRLIS